jgi:hypothetical protein
MRPARLAAAAGTVFGGLVAGPGLADTGDPAARAVVLLFLLAAPALSVAALLSSLGFFARLLVALSAATGVSALVAEVMVITGAWSLPGGVLTVTAVAALLWLMAPAGETGPGRHGGNRLPAAAPGSRDQ